MHDVRMPETTGMKHAQKAWAIQRPDKVIITSMIRSTRQEAIKSFRDHLSRDYKPIPWQTAHRYGFKVVKVTLTSATQAESNKITKRQSNGGYIGG